MIFFQALVPNKESVTIPKQNFDNIPPLIAKGKQVTIKNVSYELSRPLIDLRISVAPTAR